MDSNLYYHATHSKWMVKHFERMRAIGMEKSSVFENPLFMNPAEEDFSFMENSPALELGIEPLEVSKMGMK